MGFYDPLTIVQKAKDDNSEMQTLGWYRHAEIKHGRVAMAAFVGFVVQSNGITWPGNLTPDLSYADLSAVGGPADQWDALPTAAKLQLLGFVGFLELFSETTFFLNQAGEKHYVYGGKPGFFPKFSDCSLPHPVPAPTQQQQATEASPPKRGADAGDASTATAPRTRRPFRRVGDYSAFWRSFVSDEKRKQRPHHLLDIGQSGRAKRPAEAGLRVLLEWLGLGKYAPAFEEEGYRDVTLLREASPKERREILVGELNLKEADAQRLAEALEALLPDLTDPLER